MNSSIQMAWYPPPPKERITQLQALHFVGSAKKVFFRLKNRGEIQWSGFSRVPSNSIAVTQFCHGVLLPTTKRRCGTLDAQSSTRNSILRNCLPCHTFLAEPTELCLFTTSECGSIVWPKNTKITRTTLRKQGQLGEKADHRGTDRGRCGLRRIPYVGPAEVKVQSDVWAGYRGYSGLFSSMQGLPWVRPSVQ